MPYTWEQQGICIITVVLAIGLLENHVILSYITLFCAQAWLPLFYGDLLNTYEVKTGTNCLHGVTNVIVFFIITVILFS